MAYQVLPPDGVMLLHTIVVPRPDEIKARGLPVTMRHLRFSKFITDEIFPGGRLPSVTLVGEHAIRGGFAVTLVQPLRPHYARTLHIWVAALQAHKHDAIAIQSREVYDRYMHYLTGCAELFGDGYTDVCQFTLTKQ
jgi:cyclopropane-fatty-acyl-phospholipid synthase